MHNIFEEVDLLITFALFCDVPTLLDISIADDNDVIVIV